LQDGDVLSVGQSDAVFSSVLHLSFQAAPWSNDAYAGQYEPLGAQTHSRESGPPAQHLGQTPMFSPVSNPHPVPEQVLEPVSPVANPVPSASHNSNELNRSADDVSL
jgi:hypothetical protein